MEDSVIEHENDVRAIRKKFVKKGAESSELLEPLDDDRLENDKINIRQLEGNGESLNGSTVEKESQPNPTMKASVEEQLKSYNIFLSDIVSSSQQMLNFAASSGRKIDPDTSNTITVFSHKLIKNESWSAKEQTCFLEASSNLAFSLLPVTYDSLRSSTSKLAEKYVRSFGLLTIGLLLFLIVAQSYWVVINTAANSIESNSQDKTRVMANIEKLKNQVKLLDPNSKVLLPSPMLNIAVPTGDKKDELEAEISRLRNEIKDNEEVSKRADDAINTNKNLIEKLLPIEIAKYQPKGSPADVSADLIIVWARQVLQVMSAYILPLIYGLVGAGAYVLRTISTQIRLRTFSRTDSSIQFFLHLVLGALAGVAIGWFLKQDPSAESFVTSLSPLALAFVAGYSVELVFTIIDKFISLVQDKSQMQEKSK